MDGMRDRLMNELKKAKSRCLIYESGGCLACKQRGRADCTLETIVDHLLANGVIAPPCKVGDTVYMLLEDDFPVHKWCISEERVTEVGSRGFWVSGFEPPEDDMGVFIPYESVCVNCRGRSGKTIITNAGTIIHQDFIDTKDGADNGA